MRKILTRRKILERLIFVLRQGLDVRNKRNQKGAPHDGRRAVRGRDLERAATAGAFEIQLQLRVNLHAIQVKIAMHEKKNTSHTNLQLRINLQHAA